MYISAFYIYVLYFWSSFLLFSSSYYLCKPSNYLITIIIRIIFINFTIRGVLEKSSRRDFKEVKELKWHDLPLFIHFRGAYRTHAASEVELFVILVSGFWPLYNVTGN